LADVFNPKNKYVKHPVDYVHRLELVGDGQGATFYFDASEKVLVEKPQYYRSCEIKLTDKNDSKKKWSVNLINDDSDVVYEFTEDKDGRISDGIEKSRENLS
jgi:hypothetical protein